jgi:hypothetical protein
MDRVSSKQTTFLPKISTNLHFIWSNYVQSWSAGLTTTGSSECKANERSGIQNPVTAFGLLRSSPSPHPYPKVLEKVGGGGVGHWGIPSIGTEPADKCRHPTGASYSLQQVVILSSLVYTNNKGAERPSFRVVTPPTSVYIKYTEPLFCVLSDASKRGAFQQYNHSGIASILLSTTNQ